MSRVSIPHEVEMLILSFSTLRIVGRSHLVCRQWDESLRHSYAGNMIWYFQYRAKTRPATKQGEQKLFEAFMREKHNHSFWRNLFKNSLTFSERLECIWERKAFSDEIWHGSWSQDSKYFGCSSKDGEIGVWKFDNSKEEETEVGGKHPKITLHFKKKIAGNPKLSPFYFSPSSKYVLTTTRGNFELILIHLESMKVTRQKFNGERFGHSRWIDDEHIILGQFGNVSKFQGGGICQVMYVVYLKETENQHIAIEATKSPVMEFIEDEKENSQSLALKWGDIFSPIGRYKDSFLFKTERMIVSVDICHLLLSKEQIESVSDDVRQFGGKCIQRSDMVDVLGEEQFDICTSIIRGDYLIMNTRNIVEDEDGYDKEPDAMLHTLIFNLSTKQFVQKVSGPHTAEGYALVYGDGSFGSEKNVLCSASMTHSLYFWNSEFGNLLAEVKNVHVGSANGCQMSSDSQFCISYGDDGIIKVFKIPNL